MKPKSTGMTTHAIMTCSDKDCRHGTRLEYRIDAVPRSMTVNDSCTCEKCGKRAHGLVNFQVRTYAIK